MFKSSGRVRRLAPNVVRGLAAATIAYVLQTTGVVAQPSAQAPDVGDGHGGHGAGPPVSQAAHKPQDLLFFVSARYTRLTDVAAPSGDGDLTPSADIFYTRGADRFRILAEYLITDDEHDLERFQVGWQLSETTRIWLGRFHQSASYWNTEHHHGQFLQTPIYRPAMEEFEDVGGVLPSHTTGVLLEHQRKIGSEAGLQLSFSAGLTSTLAALELQQLEPYDLLDPESGHGDSVSLRAGLFPDFLGDDQIGLAYGRHTLNVEPGVQLPAAWAPGVDEIDLTTIGLYTDWSWGKWRLAATADQVGTTPRGGLGGPHTEFVAAYAQTEYRFRKRWVAYARLEQTSGTEDYLDIFPLYVRRQSLAGAKWLVSSKHSVNIEMTSSSTQTDRFHRLSIQWSAVVP